MMGRQKKVQKKLFYTKFNLDRRIRKDHILRKINEDVNFDFIFNQVKDIYGCKGNVSVPPPVLLKMMLLLILYNVRSERELMITENAGSQGLICDHLFTDQALQFSLSLKTVVYTNVANLSPSAPAIC